MIQFTCPNCKNWLEANDEEKGMQFPCPMCGHALTIPPPARPKQSHVISESNSGRISDWPENLDQNTFRHGSIEVPAGEYSFRLTSIADAKLAIKQLRAIKKSLQLQKRAVMQQQREIRAAYTEAIRQRGSKFIGGGTIGRVIRAFQTYGRDAARRQLAEELAPLEHQRSVIDSNILQVDAAILQAQVYIAGR